jgi:hypothetical protein
MESGDRPFLFFFLASAANHAYRTRPRVFYHDPKVTDHGNAMVTFVCEEDDERL